MALLLALLALLLISAIGLGMVYMSNMESEIAYNYKDTQTAFFSVRAGLEEMRDRMQANSPSSITLPTTMPPNVGSIVYITNPAAGETVTPATAGSAYFDDEFCHELFNLAGGTPYSTTCATGPPAGSFTTVASVSPYTGTAAALKYKWVRVTLKQNATVGTVATQYVDSAQPAGSQVCWNQNTSLETTSTSLGAYATCALAAAAGYNVEPVYLVTALAITPQGSRRVAQYETAALNITPPASALALDGPGATFNPAPHSNNYFASGNNSAVNVGNTGVPSTYTPWTGPAGQCNSLTPTQAPAVSTGDQAGANSISNPATGIPANRDSNYTGTAPPAPAGPTPSVVNEGGAGGPLASSQWSSPSQLNTLVSEMSNMANNSLTCGIGGAAQTVGGPTAACTPPAGGLGTDAAPLITFVNGDFNMGANSGAGILIVTGTLSITGNSSFDGLIMVVGQGVLTENGGGNGQFNGSLFLANTNNSAYPFSQLATLGSPQIQWNGGGTNGIQYNSCWADINSNLGYIVVASREEMY
jgi:hypothetical protein